MALPQAAYYVALAGSEFYAMFRQVVETEGFKGSAPLLSTDKCFTQDGTASYTAVVGGAIDQALCMFNSVFLAAYPSAEARMAMKVLLSVTFSTFALCLYESYRPVHRRSNILASIPARCASLSFAAGQYFTMGFTVPLYCACAVLSNHSGMAQTKGLRNTLEQRTAALLPSGRDAWITLLSVTGGFLLPSLYVDREDMSYFSLTIWQPFPLYVLALSLSLKQVLPSLPRRPAIAAIALVCTAVSATIQYQLVNGVIHDTLDLRDVFLVPPQSAAFVKTLTYSSHLLFLVDLLFTLLAATPFVLLSFPSSGIVARIVGFVAMSAGLGPGAALILPWAFREISLENTHAAADRAEKRAL